MSSKEQKTPEGQAPEEIIMDQHEEIEAVEPEASAEQVDPRDEKIANLEAQLAEAQTRERDGILRVKAEMENLRRRTELDIEKAHKFALEKFINELLPVIDSLDRALEVADKANPDMSAMVEGIELTLKSMLDVVRKFGVEVIAETNVPLDPNVHQAIAMVESDDVAPGNVLGIMQKGYTLNGRTIRAAMVTVAKKKVKFIFFKNSTALKANEGPFSLLRHTLAQRFHRKNFYLLNHIVLYVENIYIVLAKTHAGACDRDLFQCLKNDAINRAGIIFR